MRKADLEDLYREKWLRERDNNEIVWTAKDGKGIPLKYLTDSHIDNIINYLTKREEIEEIAAEFAARIDSNGLG